MIMSNRVKYPCQDCKRRYVGCHAECDDYKKAKAEQDRIKQEIWQSNVKRFISDDYVLERRGKWKRRQK